MALPKDGDYPSRLYCHYLARGRKEPVLALALLGQVRCTNGITANVEKHPGALAEALAGKSARAACDVLAVSEKRPGRGLAQVITLELYLQHMRCTSDKKLVFQCLHREAHLVSEIVLSERRHVAVRFIEKMHAPGINGQVVEVALYAHRRIVHNGPLSSMLAGPPCLLAGWRRDR